MAHHQLDELDEKILKLIIGNARMPFLEVARECNVSGAAIHQRIQKLTNLGVIKGSEFIVDNTKVGYETCAYMGLFLKSPGQFEGFVYAEHFAIDESARNGGIGAKAMTSFLALHEDPVVLEVEMPTEEMSKRRIGFYERLGFVLDHHVYFQPPYRKGEAFLEMRLMTHGKLDLEQSFERVKTIIHQNVYGVE